MPSDNCVSPFDTPKHIFMILAFRFSVFNPFSLYDIDDIYMVVHFLSFDASFILSLL